MAAEPYLTQMLYPSEHASTFKLDYYINTHMRMTWESWKDQGLLDWSVVELDPACGYHVQCIMTWASKEASEKAYASASVKPLFDDLKNFSVVPPTRFLGYVVGGSG